MKLTVKLSIFFALISMIIIFIVSYISYNNTRSAIEEKIIEIIMMRENFGAMIDNVICKMGKTKISNQQDIDLCNNLSSLKNWLNEYVSEINDWLNKAKFFPCFLLLPPPVLIVLCFNKR